MSKKITIIFVIVLFLYLCSLTVTWEKNEHTVEVLDKYNNTEQQTKVYYSSEDLVPVKNIGENRVGSHFGMAQVFIIMVIISIYLIWSQKEDDKDEIPEAEQKKYLLEQLSLRTDIVTDSIFIYDDTIVQKVQIDDEKETKPNRLLFAEIKYRDDSSFKGETILYAFSMNNHKFAIEEWVKMQQYQEGFHAKCHICGAFPDKKIFTPAGLKIYNEHFKD